MKRKLNLAEGTNPMKITTVKIEDLSINYPFELIADPKEIIFVDIETTGFSRGFEQVENGRS